MLCHLKMSSGFQGSVGTDSASLTFVHRDQDIRVRAECYRGDIFAVLKRKCSGPVAIEQDQSASPKYAKLSLTLQGQTPIRGFLPGSGQNFHQE